MAGGAAIRPCWPYAAGLRFAAALLLASRPAVGAGGDDEWCGSSISGDKCRTVVVNRDGCKRAFTNDKVYPFGEAEASPHFRLRAVHYVPRPVGVDPDLVDIFDDDYAALHRRDLEIIKQVLKANAVRLGPWETSLKHQKFVQLCKDVGLFMIPTFDLAYFVRDPRMKTQPWDKRIQAMERRFSEFMEQLGPDAPVLMWSLNLGLFLNETVPNGQLSLADQNIQRNEYFQFLEAIRRTHHLHEWNAEKREYNRPLAIPLLLDTYNKISEVNWFMKFMEKNWDRFSEDSTAEKPGGSGEFGSFDVWLAETVALPRDELIRAVKFMHMRNEEDACVGREVDDECGYSSEKAIVLQYGFSALHAGRYLSSRDVKPEIQQAQLKDVWNALAKPEDNADHCLQGGVIDEWVDDWNRCASLGYASSNYMHDKGGECSQVSNSYGPSHIEWYGLNGQYSHLFSHCIDPRFMGKDGFRFEPYDEAADQAAWASIAAAGISLCEMRIPAQWKIFRGALFIMGFFFILIWRASHIRKREKQHFAEELGEEEMPTSGTNAVSRTLTGLGGRHSVVRPEGPRATLTGESSRVVYDGVDLRVPSFLNDEHSFKFVLEVKDPTDVLVSAKPKPIDRFTKDQVRFIVSAHAKAQARRLQHQVESEAYAVQDKSRQASLNGAIEELQLCYDQAMRNVHSRAVEGYAAWLADQAEVRQDFAPARDELLDNSQRRPWELWVEALLLRTVESLAEQLLHAPELVHAIYHRIRQPEGKPWSREEPVFFIDYRLLHKGIEALKEKPNPYEGGVNFDDLNDCGRINDEDLEIRKTYQESSGLWVTMDIVSNFLPVACVKIWLFLLAWYLHLILKTVNTTDARNGTFFQPQFLAGNTIQIFAIFDAAFGFIIEFAILVHGVRQGRLQWLGKGLWLLRHGVNLLLTFIGTAVLWSVLDIKTLDWEWKAIEAALPENRPKESALTACFGYWLIRVAVFGLLHQRQGVASFIPGKPPGRKDPEVSGVQGARSAAELDNTGVESHERAPGIKEHYVAGDDWYIIMGRRLVWFCMLGGCFVFEVFFIAPLAADFDHHEFCKISCVARADMVNTVIDFPAWLRVGNDCWACRGTLLLTWALVGLTGFFDIYYMFYFGTAVVGYGMGESRGLRNVLSTALRYLDFNTRSTRIKALSSLRRIQNINDGELMCRVFGTSWRVIWSRLVESLYEECLITAKERDNLVKVAGTMPWAKRKEHDNFKPSDTFQCLKFVSTASRGSNRAIGADVGHERTKCISGLLVRETRDGEAHRLKVPEQDYVTQEVSISSAAERDKVLGALVRDNRDNPDRSILELTAAVELQGAGEAIMLKERWRIVSAPDSALRHGSSEEAMLEMFMELADFPAIVAFKTTAKYNECILRFDSPCRVHSVCFLKTHDDPAMDPIQWRVEGLHLPGPGLGDKDGQWKQLIWQDMNIEPRSLGRGESTEDWFEVECWRQKMHSPDSVDLNEMDPVVAERLGFFAASLKGIIDDMEHPIRHGVDSLMDSHIGNVPSLSQIIPVYGETVIIEEKNLMQSDGVNTNLGFLISQFDNEWDNFAKKLGKDPESLYQSFVSGSLRERANKEDRHNLGKAREAAELIMEIRLWASMRSQTVSRTVVGAIQYHEVLSLVPGIREVDSKGGTLPEDDERIPRENLEKCVELILAHQTYGQKRKDDKKGLNDSDKDVQYLLKKYSDKPFYLVLDYNEKTAEAGLQQKVHSFMHSQYQYSGKLQFASVLVRWRQIGSVHMPDEDGLEIVEVLPRRFPLLVGEGDFRTQGKAGNQLGALRFARGHYLQMMDSNMGAFLGEACKVPFVLRRFCPFNFNRASVTARIIGFREFIFTEQHGTVGDIMASAEFSFGTICQRFLAGLGARMHYGHPDFLDGFWASNRGSLSKASPGINLSEDIFAGFNVAMRGEKSTHVDTLAWEKGREASFNASSLFFSKVSGGNAGVMRSRDLKIISENLSIVDNFSFYFASIGFYLNNLLIDQSVMCYVVLFVLLSLSSKTLEDVGERYSVLATEWCLSLGIVAMFPRFMELTLEYGILEGMLRFVPSVPGCMAMFTFINKSIASSVKDTMMTGKAHYISTGRPNANTHYGWRECYFIFCKSHYYPAFSVCYCYTLYYLFTLKLDISALPMMVLMFSVLLWIVAPIVFCPQPTLRTLAKDLSQFWQFCIATPPWSVRKIHLGNKTTEEMLHAQISNPRSTLYEYWLLEELKSKEQSMLLRVLQMVGSGCKYVMLLSVVHTSMVDEVLNMLVLFAAQLLLMEVWRLLYRPTALMMLLMITGLVVPLWWFQMALLDFMVVLAVFNFGLRTFHDFVLILATFYYKPDNSWTKWDTSTEEERARKRQKQKDTQRYDVMVEYLFVNFQQHLQHLYCAAFILLLNLATQLVMVFLDMAGGIHSGLLLNLNLCGSCGSKRPGFEPLPSAEDGGRARGRRRGSSAHNSFAAAIGQVFGQPRGSFLRPGQQTAPDSFEMRDLAVGMVGGAAAQQQLLRDGGASTLTPRA